ncbi:hypothetical protein DMENIID0001_043170 [Sergentomyia squamirostris]
MSAENSSKGKETPNEKRLIDLIHERITSRRDFYSMEVSPGEIVELTSLKHLPLFISVTWIEDTNLQAFRKDPYACPALEMVRTHRDQVSVLSHLSCFNMTSGDLEGIIRMGEIQNVLAVKGNLSSATQEFTQAADLIRSIKKLQPNATIAVTGYPSYGEKHNWHVLKTKLDAGADMIILQMDFNAENIVSFIKSCHENGIHCPIIPGFFIPRSFDSIKKVLRLYKIQIDNSLLAEYEKYQEDQESFEQFALTEADRWLTKIKEHLKEDFYGFHIFTMNNFVMTRRILEKYNFL